MSRAGSNLIILITAGNAEQDTAAWRVTTASLKGWHVNMTASDYSQLLPSSLATMSAWWSYSVGQTGFKDPQYEQLVTSIGTEPDAAKRATLYSQLNDFLLDQSFAMVVAPNPSRLLARTNVQGIHFFHHEALDFSSTSLSQLSQ